MNTLTHGYDPLTGFILITAIVVLVVVITLWRGRRLAQLSKTVRPKQPPPPRRGKTDHTGSNSDSLSEEPPPHQRHGWPATIQEVHRLLNECQRLNNTHNHKGVERTARKALAKAMQLTPEHWLVGLSLDWLAFAETCQGRHYDALGHLEAAAVILMEWPQHDRHRRDSILPRLAACRQILGFAQEGDDDEGD